MPAHGWYRGNVLVDDRLDNLVDVISVGKGKGNMSMDGTGMCMEVVRANDFFSREGADIGTGMIRVGGVGGVTLVMDGM